MVSSASLLSNDPQFAGNRPNSQQPFDIDERVALSGNCDFPMAGESHSLFLTGGRPCSFSVSINMHDNLHGATSENKSTSELPEVRGSDRDRMLILAVE
ncbi:MAG: hypothetical protein CMN21_23750 [Rubinisphaera sp.]|nr:hypothetical protein [Rubinisphaera sp.]